MESQYKHGSFGMRETKSRRIHTIARNEETESVPEEIKKIRCMWISKK